MIIKFECKMTITLQESLFNDKRVWEMLTSALRALVKNPIKESFDIIFMGKEKS